MDIRAASERDWWWKIVCTDARLLRFSAQMWRHQWSIIGLVPDSRIELAIDRKLIDNCANHDQLLVLLV